MLSDGQIIERVLKGRVQEFRGLVERYEQSAFRLAYRMLGRREEAEDAAQDAFLRVYRSLHTFSQLAPFWPWLRRIVVNCCIDRFSREFPSDTVEVLIDADGPFEDSVETEILKKCEMETARRIIEGLPPAYKTVVVLRFLEDLSTNEIAQMLGEHPVTIRVRQHRALKMLTERLAVIEYEL